MQKRISPLEKSFSKTLEVTSDKSISHRAVLFGAIAEGETKITNALMSDDVLSTIDCVKRLGARVKIEGDTITVKGTQDILSAELDAGNSGTTMRLLSGVLVAQEKKEYVFDGDASLRKRPMNRIQEPLSQMGAKIELTNNSCPLRIAGSKLTGIEYKMPVDSAQVKSAILLAGIFADKETSVIERVRSRNHTENMLKTMGADIKIKGLKTTVKRSALKPQQIYVPSDISSAAFPLVFVASSKEGCVTVKNVLLNETRTGILSVFRTAGVDFTVKMNKDGVEPYGDITVNGGKRLTPFWISRDIMPSLIDEIPILAVLACFIDGVSVIKGAEELKFKESNRIKSVVNALSALGAEIDERDDGMIIKGKGFLKGGAEIDTFYDHRIAMSMAIAGALSKEGAIINDAECVSVSYPSFYSDIFGTNA